MAKSRDNSLSFFQVLRVNRKFELTLECEKVFHNLKKYLRTLPPLIKPAKGDASDTLVLYLSTSPVVVSSALVKEIAKRQLLVLSKVLTNTKINYLEV